MLAFLSALRVFFRSRTDYRAGGPGAPTAGRGAETQTAAARPKPAGLTFVDQPASLLAPLGRGRMVKIAAGRLRRANSTHPHCDHQAYAS